MQPQNDYNPFQSDVKDTPPPNNINDSHDELFAGRGTLTNDDDDATPLRSFTFAGNSPFSQELTQEEKVAEAVNTAVVGISKTFTEKINTLEQIIVQQTDTIESMIEKQTQFQDEMQGKFKNCLKDNKKALADTRYNLYQEMEVNDEKMQEKFVQLLQDYMRNKQQRQN